MTPLPDVIDRSEYRCVRRCGGRTDPHRPGWAGESVPWQPWCSRACSWAALWSRLRTTRCDATVR